MKQFISLNTLTLTLTHQPHQASTILTYYTIQSCAYAIVGECGHGINVWTAASCSFLLPLARSRHFYSGKGRGRFPLTFTVLFVPLTWWSFLLGMCYCAGIAIVVPELGLLVFPNTSSSALCLFVCMCRVCSVRMRESYAILWHSMRFYSTSLFSSMVGISCCSVPRIITCLCVCVRWGK